MLHSIVKAPDLLVQHTTQKADTGEICERQLANAAQGDAYSGRVESLAMLFAVLTWVAEQRVGESNTQDLANTAWAFAATRQ